MMRNVGRCNMKFINIKNVVTVSFIIVFTFALAGCSTSFFTAPTAIPSATHAPTSTSTPTQTPTATSTKTPTATPRPVVQLGERLTVPAGGFSFRVPIAYASQIEERQAFISDLEGTLIISFAGAQSTSSEEEIIDEYLDVIASRGDGEFEKTPADPVTVNGIEGQAFDLTGSMFGSPLQGKTFIVPIRSNHFLFGLAMSNLSSEEQNWEDHGSKVFEAVIESIEFVEPQHTETCPITTDDTYGYNKENAIRVGEGGEFFGGPAREKAYLDNLRGPNGEPITYERLGSLTFEDTILDEYIITGLASPITLYIDIYSFDEPMAPAGFTCAGPFNLKP
jgi:hypothetical protein